jgi:hypothetical protein
MVMNHVEQLLDAVKDPSPFPLTYLLLHFFTMHDIIELVRL